MTSAKRASEGPSSGSPGGAAPASPCPAPSSSSTGAHRSTVLDALGAVSGLGRPAVDSILVEVRANLAKLDACPTHKFVGVKETAAGPAKDGSYLYRDYRCTNCGGKVDSHAERWYRRGTSDGFKAGELNALTSLERFLRESVISAKERLKELETDLECINFSIWSSVYSTEDEVHEKVARSAAYRESLRLQAETLRVLVDAVSRLDALKAELEHAKGGGK